MATQVILLRTRKNREMITEAATVETSDCCYHEVAGERVRLSILTLPDGKKLHEKIQYKWFTNPELNAWLAFICLEDSYNNEVPGAKWRLEEMTQERKGWVKILMPRDSVGMPYSNRRQIS